MFVELISTNKKRNVLHINGYLYSYRGNGRSDQTWWTCMKQNQCDCVAQAVTVHLGTSILVLKGPNEWAHSHAPDFSEIFAWKAEANNNYFESIGKPHETSPSHQAVVTESHRYKKPHLKRCPELYRAFLQHFSKDPTFNKRSIYKSLKFVFKSYSTIATSYNDIMHYEKRVRLDLETLRKNPNAAIAPLDEEYRVCHENQARHQNPDKKKIPNSKFKHPRGTEVRGQIIPPCPAAIPISWIRLERSLTPLVIDLAEKFPATEETTAEDSSQYDKAGNENDSNNETTSIVLDRPDDSVCQKYTQNRPVYINTRLPVLWVDRHSDTRKVKL